MGDVCSLAHFCWLATRLGQILIEVNVVYLLLLLHDMKWNFTVEQETQLGKTLQGVCGGKNEREVREKETINKI